MFSNIISLDSQLIKQKLLTSIANDNLTSIFKFITRHTDLMNAISKFYLIVFKDCSLDVKVKCYLTSQINKYHVTFTRL